MVYLYRVFGRSTIVSLAQRSVVDEVSLLVLSHFRLVPAFALYGYLRGLLEVLFVYFGSGTRNDELLQPMKARGRGSIKVLFRGRFKVGQSHQLGGVFYSGVNTTRHYRNAPYGFTTMYGADSFQSLIAYLGVSLQFQLTSLVSTIDSFYRVVYVGLFRFYHTFLFARHLTSDFGEALVVFGLFHVVVGVSYQCTNYVRLELRVEFMLLFRMRQGGSSVQVREGRLFHVGDFFICNASREGLFRFQGVHFRVVPRINAVLARKQVGSRGRVNSVFTYRDYRHRGYATQDAPLRGGTFYQLLRHGLLSYSVHGLGELIVLYHVLFRVSHTSTNYRGRTSRRGGGHDGKGRVPLYLGCGVYLGRGAPRSLGIWAVSRSV